MRVLVAGATGVVGRLLVPMLVDDGDEVAGLTRSNGALVAGLGAAPIVCDVYDAGRLRELVGAFAPEAVVHLLTDLPDDESELAGYASRNARIRREGTRNLLAAAPGAFVVAQSISFAAGGDGAAAVEELERLVRDAGGVVLRFGRLYGPGTYYPEGRPRDPATPVDEAARAIRDALRR